MTSDAKIGLLLGLLFIFLIAFIVNGLPSFRNDKNSNELTTNMVGLRNNPPGIGTKERKVSRKLINPTAPAQKQSPKLQTPPTGNQDIRFKMQLPESTSTAKETKKTIETRRTTASAIHVPTITEKSQTRKPEPVKPILPKVYIVREGDNLTIIAKKLYGPEHGNKEVNTTRIFQANRKLLNSPDEVYVGQKLIIPPLSVSAPNKSKLSNLLSSSILEKVESIGKRHLWTDGRRAKQTRQYIVREGDSLWQIAAEQLGEGTRYSEIARLNADILDEEDSLSIGMCLKIPVR